MCRIDNQSHEERQVPLQHHGAPEEPPHRREERGVKVAPDASYAARPGHISSPTKAPAAQDTQAAEASMVRPPAVAGPTLSIRAVSVTTVV